MTSGRGGGQNNRNLISIVHKIIAIVFLLFYWPSDGGDLGFGGGGGIFQILISPPHPSRLGKTLYDRAHFTQFYKFFVTSVC